jgi:hypothetical protein
MTARVVQTISNFCKDEHEKGALLSINQMSQLTAAHEIALLM